MSEIDLRPVAYSYIRMSSKRQIKGDSLRRQLELSKQYAERHGLRLDEETTFADKGVSAWTGANLTEGRFGQFLDAAKQGKIKAGSYLLVESLDRISRQQVRTALVPFMELINSDIVIVTLADNQVYSKATVDANFTQLIISLTVMARAHEESETKSKRLRAVAENRRTNAANGIGRFHPMTNGWIEAVKVGHEKWEFKLNSHAAAVQRIFELADSGIGQVTIAQRLNREGVPTFRGKGQWFQANVGRIIRDEVCIGTYQPTHVIEGERRPFGEPIKNYYPAVVSEELFWRVQRGLRISFGRGRHKGNRITNLFSGQITCQHCGSSLRLRTGGKKHYLYCDNFSRTGTCEKSSGLYRYDVLEEAIFKHLTILDPDFERGGTDDKSRDQILKAIELTEQNAKKAARQYDNLMAFIEMADDDEDRKNIMARLKPVRQEREQANARIRELNEELATLDTHRKEMTSAAERMEQERLKWTSDDPDVVYESRARVARLLKRFISAMSINFEEKTVMVGIAGGLRGYMFDRKGNIINQYDLVPEIDKQGRPVLFAERDENGKPDFENAREIISRGPSIDPFINISGFDHFEDVVERRKIADVLVNDRAK
ncbi:recombinase family protein [Agrobacterium sp. DKPNP3]|uniref:recombinase family protein n=1 Tax=Agrobacterium sp. DKPNP3 TaxID=3457323 RepID=UPI004044534D